MPRVREPEAPPQVVFEMNRPNGDVLRATLSTYKGKAYVGVRVYYRDDAGEFLPGRNGCNLPVDEVHGLALAILTLLRETTQSTAVLAEANEMLRLMAAERGA